MAETPNLQKIVERIVELETKLKLFINRWVPAGIVTADVEEFVKGRIYPNVKYEDGKLKFRDEDGHYRTVMSGKFRKLAKEIMNRLLKQGFVVVVELKATGNSVLPIAVIWELFLNGDIGLIARVNKIDSENYSEFVTFIENYGEELSKYIGKLFVLYDPNEADIQENIKRTIRNLMNTINSMSSKAPKPFVLIAIQSDVYNTLSEEIRTELERYRFDVSLTNIDEEKEEEE
jgi:hypothetical protein